jgi:hypothetical protein
MVVDHFFLQTWSSQKWLFQLLIDRIPKTPVGEIFLTHALVSASISHSKSSSRVLFGFSAPKSRVSFSITFMPLLHSQKHRTRSQTRASAAFARPDTNLSEMKGLRCLTRVREWMSSNHVRAAARKQLLRMRRSFFSETYTPIALDGGACLTTLRGAERS